MRWCLLVILVIGNMHLHFLEDHLNINFPKQLQISDEEIKAVKKLVIYCN